MAFPKCLDRALSGDAGRAEVACMDTALLRDSTFDAFAGPRFDSFDGCLTPFDEGPAFAGFPFKWLDLALAEAWPALFLLGLDFDFVFIALGPGTYTSYAS